MKTVNATRKALKGVATVAIFLGTLVIGTVLATAVAALAVLAAIPLGAYVGLAVVRELNTSPKQRKAKREAAAHNLPAE